MGAPCLAFETSVCRMLGEPNVVYLHAEEPGAVSTERERTPALLDL